MQHINAIVVLSIDITPSLKQEIDERNISSEAGKVKSSEAIVIGFLVDPLVDLIFSNALPSVLED